MGDFTKEIGSTLISTPVLAVQISDLVLEAVLIYFVYSHPGLTQCFWQVFCQSWTPVRNNISRMHQQRFGVVMRNFDVYNNNNNMLAYMAPVCQKTSEAPRSRVSRPNVYLSLWHLQHSTCSQLSARTLRNQLQSADGNSNDSHIKSFVCDTLGHRCILENTFLRAVSDSMTPDALQLQPPEDTSSSEDDDDDLVTASRYWQRNALLVTSVSQQYNIMNEKL